MPVLLGLLASTALACAGPGAVCETGGTGALPLVAHGVVPSVVVAAGEPEAVRRAAAGLRGDLDRVAGPSHRIDPKLAVIVGTPGHNPVIDRLAAEKRIDLSQLTGRWEAFLSQVVDHPAPGIIRALVIVGADRRGAAFGAYDLSRRAGVSPWAWWADVAVPVRAALSVRPGARIDAPAVKYRGLFINDEDPALSGWAKAKFGGVNHLFYEHEFELILRLKGNFIWPAMWGKSFWEDDPADADLADAMGIVVGTSHHEPMLRAQADWHHADGGAWDYLKNGDRLRAFWRQGIERNAGREALVTVGMRGDGDEPMTQGTAIGLLQGIVSDQRRIIADVTGRPAAETPQVWALYKEVQDYYDKGMKVPDDVTLLFSDDNWGNIRRLPDPAAPKRAGGYGIYYHFDYVGGPRNYKWLNVTQVGRVWEQMSQARAAGADRLWIANVGDLKPMELPISFFLDYAWKPEAYGPDAGRTYLRAWAAEQFGPAHAAEIADILDREARYSARRTPELTAAETWDVATEWPRIVADYDRLEADATRVGRALPPAMADSYYELVLHPVQAFANLHRMYRAVALNRAHAAAGLSDTPALADEAARLFANDRAIAARYEGLAGAKWPHMMAQTHIGYVGWQQPETDMLPAVARTAGPVAAPAPARHPVPGEYVAIDAIHGTSEPRVGAAWTAVAGLGRTGSAMALLPRRFGSWTAGSGPALRFDVTLSQAGMHLVQVVAAPSLPTAKAGHLRYAVQVDAGPITMMDLAADATEAGWAKGVIGHALLARTPVDMAAGRHSIRLWAIDPAVVVERMVVSAAPVDVLALDWPERR
jgi:hypothetical protein